MGRSSGGEGGAGGDAQGDADVGGIEDCSPGTIVWVRRRNGSWWPGRILGQGDLPASQVVSPKTGTPVKLLGREDASIDWYNLEKSKRVKEFRCGEFDACIEKAKSCQPVKRREKYARREDAILHALEFDACIEKAKSCQPVKRREKYARREDAILHALELERKQLASKYQNQGFRGKEFDKFASEYYSRNNVQEPHLHLQSSATQQQVDLSTTRYKSKKGNKRKGNNSILLGKTKGKTKECEQKFVHAGSKRNLSGSLVLEASGKTLSNHINGFSHPGYKQGGSTLESGEENAALKKRGLEEDLFEESLVRKHDRCRPLAHVVQKPRSFQCNDDSGTVGVEGGNDPLPSIYQDNRSGATHPSTDFRDAHGHDSLLAKQIVLTEPHHETGSYPKQQDTLSREQAFLNFVEKHESDSSAGECSETETEDDAELLQRYAKRQSPELDACDPNSLQSSKKLRHANDIDDEDEVTFSTHIPQLSVLEDEDGSSDLGASQWHMKGKRNQRGAVKRQISKVDENLSIDNSDTFMKGSVKMTNESDSKMGSIGGSTHQPFCQSFFENQELDCDFDGTDLVDKAASYPELDPYYGNDYPSSSKPTRDNGQSYTFNGSETPCKTSLLNKKGNQISSVGRKGCWEGSSLYQRNSASHLGSTSPLLFDVELKVQTKYQGERVPLVSLMSKLNGKAIIGHPIQVDKLKEGSVDSLVLGSDLVLEQSAAAAPAWPTGRRTAMPRVPRSNPSRATLDGDDGGGLWDMKAPFDRFPAPSSQQGVGAQRPFSQKSQKKPSGTKKGSSPSQKIRALSSISKKNRREGGQGKAQRRSDILGGLLKSDGAIPLVTCVPAKVVFSRIMEAVGRPSLAHRVRKADPAMRDPP